MMVGSELFMYEKRSATRHPLSVPVVFDSGRGRTRDMSGSGIYFVTEDPIELGPLRFSVALDTMDDDHELIECVGQVVRIDEMRDHRGVAARIHSMEL
jgi:c-di-GMP-binding flagellar brake protein YcgR